MRRKLAEDGALEAPPAHVWPAVSQTLPAAAPRAGGLGLPKFLGGMLVGILMWWGGGMILPELVSEGEKQVLKTEIGRENHQTGGENFTTGGTNLPSVVTTPPIGGTDSPTGVTALPTGSTDSPTGVTVLPSGVTNLPTSSTDSPTGGTNFPIGVTNLPTSGTPFPTGLTVSAAPDTLRSAQTTRETAPHLWVRALTLDTTIRRARQQLPLDTARLRPLVAEQARTVAALVASLDSAKLALNPLPVAPPVAAISSDSVPAKADSVAAVPVPVPSLWAVALLAETTTPWGMLPTASAPAPTAETRETLRSATTHGLHLEHRLRRNDRWLLRAGFGDTRLQSQLHTATDHTDRTTVERDSIATSFEFSVRRDSSFIVHLDSTLVLNPRINGAGQIIGYDSLWRDRNDTLYQIVITRDTIRRTEILKTTRIETRHERREQQLRPTYQFWTIPVAAQYDLLRWRRWRAGLSVGAQIMVFRGGQAATLIGDSYQLRRIGVREGPFRPVSLSVSTSLELRYALTDRLSVFGGGGVRGWAIDPLRTGTTPRTLLGNGQVGVSWGVGREKR